jgi:hypothetical protein
MGQPIIEGIQAVGSVEVTYKYNGTILTVPKSFVIGTSPRLTEIDTTGGLSLAGFRLDSEFFRATPMMATSFMTPILGGGAVALTNNIRAGTFSVNCTRCATPIMDSSGSAVSTNGAFKAMDDRSGNYDRFYDFVFIAQCQQATAGGDSVGSTITVEWEFNGVTITLAFLNCTIASVDPIAIAGNDLSNYNVSVNYLRWEMTYSGAGVGTGIGK